MSINLHSSEKDAKLSEIRSERKWWTRKRTLSFTLWTEYFNNLLNQSEMATQEEEAVPEIQINKQLVETLSLE